MPVLNFDETAKKFILPSTQNKSDQGWVTMPTYPLCADDYPEYYTALFHWKENVKEDPSIKEPLVNHYILARRISDWNYTDATGAKLPINIQNVKHLPLSDVAFLIMQIETEPVEELTDPKKEISSAISLPSTPANP